MQALSEPIEYGAKHSAFHVSRSIAPWVWHLIALGAYVLLGLAVMWPGPLSFFTQPMGEDYPDRAQNMWNLWWVKVALLDRHVNPFHTDMLLYPQGADLYLHTLNFPSTLLTLIPLISFGAAAAYNCSVLFALVLSAYAGFRLVHYVAGSWVPAILGGLIIGFSPLALVATRSQINVGSMQWLVLCVEFYLRAWEDGKRRSAVLMGVFFTLALLTVGYFEIYLLLFFATHLIWVVLTKKGEPWLKRIRAVFSRAGRLLMWGGGIATLLSAPYLVGVWHSLQSGQIVARSDVDVERAILNSADLLSFLVPYREHWLLGAQAPWWSALNSKIWDLAYLGVTTLALAIIGVWVARRKGIAWLWVALAALSMALALGPVLQINHNQTFGGVQIPMLYSLIPDIPPFDLMRTPIRFVTLMYVALGVLAGLGIEALIQRASRTRIPRSVIVAAVTGLLLLEMPLHIRSSEPSQLPTKKLPASMQAIQRDPGQGALLEMPFTQHDWGESLRMLFQIEHGRAITSGYLSRNVFDPYMEACSPLQVFANYSHVSEHDIVEPSALGQLPQLLGDNGIGYLAVYKALPLDSRTMKPLSAAQLSALQDLAARMGIPLGDDDVATTYRVPPSSGHAGLFLQLGPNWHGVEESYGQPFRWMDGARADLCVFSPSVHRSPLSFQVASYYMSRHVQIWVNDREVMEMEVPADSALHSVTTPPIDWPSGFQQVRLVVPEGSARPIDLSQSSDIRELSIGLSTIRIGGAGSTTLLP